MVKVILNREDIRNILAWSGGRMVEAENTGVEFDESEQTTHKKIKKALMSYNKNERLSNRV
jgi:hypothetical protein